MNREIKPPPPRAFECPECGSPNIDCPRTYATDTPSPRFVGCHPECLACGHRGPMFDNISDAFSAWEKSA